MKAERNRRIPWTILVPMIVGCLGTLPARARYAGGTGEPNAPFLIGTAEQMNEIGLREKDWDKHFALVHDVNLADDTEQGFHVIGRYVGLDDPNNKPFTGVFDGRGRTIVNFTWSSPGRYCLGLFGCLGKDGCIKNLRLANVDVNAVGSECVGALVGKNEGSITDCNSIGIVRGGEFIGGLVGRNHGVITACRTGVDTVAVAYTGGLVGVNYGTMTDCRTMGTIKGATYAGALGGMNYGTMTACHTTGGVLGDLCLGGLVGFNQGEIGGCHSDATVTGKTYDVGGLAGINSGRITDCHSTGWAWGGERVGGLVGSVTTYATLTRCYSTGGAAGRISSGGVVGTNYGTITQCYSTATVTGSLSDLGGLAGINGGWITDCYSTGWVWGGRRAGGLVGTLEFGLITNCYCSGGATGYSDVGGLVGSSMGAIIASFWDTQASGLRTSAGGTGKTTAEMQNARIYLNAGWDFADETANGEEDIWTIDEGRNYPHLSWETRHDPNASEGQ